MFPVLSFLFLLLCVDRRWDSQHPGDPKAPAHLGEQQRGPQYWQYAKHTLLQQQHSLAPTRDQKRCRATTKASHWLVCSSVFKTSFLGFIRWKKYGNKIGKSVPSHHFDSSLAAMESVSGWWEENKLLYSTSLEVSKTTTMWTKVHYEHSPTKCVGVECIHRSKGQKKCERKMWKSCWTSPIK